MTCLGIEAVEDRSADRTQLCVLGRAQRVDHQATHGLHVPGTPTDHQRDFVGSITSASYCFE